MIKTIKIIGSKEKIPKNHYIDVDYKIFEKIWSKMVKNVKF